MVEENEFNFRDEVMQPVRVVSLPPFLLSDSIFTFFLPPLPPQIRMILLTMSQLCVNQCSTSLKKIS